MSNRRRHTAAVQAFLQEHLARQAWELSLPHGHGGETYIGRSPGQAVFVKLGSQPERYRLAAAAGLTPPLLAHGVLDDGISILVQPFVAGRTPTRGDYHARLEQFAAAIHSLHHSPQLIQSLPGDPSGAYREAGLRAVERIRGKWAGVRAQVAEQAAFVDAGLEQLEARAAGFHGAGLAASHNDLCNANWLVTAAGQVYLLDLDAMSLDDPALDLGATLWWYYPPALRPRFLALAARREDPGLEQRMPVRMALHCLEILLPRPGSFDAFDPAAFAANLVDFCAALAGRDNPQGYEA